MLRVMRHLLLMVVMLSAFAAGAEETRLLHFPDLHGSRVVFTYADDLWTVSAAGGRAARLTTLQAKKYGAKFSPDGRWIAFTAERGGNYDVFVVAATGGEARRLTWHPMPDFVAGWTPDGASVLFRSRRSSFTHPIDRLFLVPRDGGAATELPLVDAGPAAFAPDGKRLVYTLHPPETWNPFRGYRGGKHAQLFLYDLTTHARTPLAPSDANDQSPSWSKNDVIYFASDRDDGRMRLYAFDARTQALRRVTAGGSDGVRNPAAAADGTPRVVYSTDGALHIVDAAGRDAALHVTVDADFAERHPRNAAVADYTTSIVPAANGDGAVITARGEVFAVDAAANRAEDLTRSSGAREASGVPSPDGRWIAYASDASGESEIYVRSTASGEVRRLTRDGRGFRDGLRWSPDSSMLLFTDETNTLFLLPLDGGAARAIDRSRTQPIDSYEWSADSSFVVYSSVGANQFGRLYRYGIVDGRTELTAGETDDFNPVVDAAGETIYYLSARNFRTSFSDFEQTFNFNDTVGIYAAPLADLRQIARRTARLPVDPGSISHLAIAGRTLLYLRRDRATGATSLHAFDLDARRDRVFADGVGDYGVRGTNVLLQRGTKLAWQRLDETAPHAQYDFASLSMALDPPAEWRQIFNEAWRFERDYFHDRSLNGVDWQAVRARYAPLLPSVATRDDLSLLLTMMVGELGTSHAWAFGGDAPQYSSAPVGVLGCDFEIDGGRYRIHRIYRGERTADETPAPLADAGVAEGSYLLKIDGRELTSADSVFARLEGTPGKKVVLTIASSAGGTGARDVTVTPIGNDMPLRYGDWVAANRARVAAATNGRCGYIHVPNTGRGGIAAFARQFFAQSDKDALIVDDRWNAGGLFPASIIEHLQRRTIARYGSRNADDVRVPLMNVDGPKVMLANAYTISGGDAFAAYFHETRLGPIVGERTAGATIGNVGMPSLIDGGEVAVPALAYRTPADAPVENRGVVPDVAVAPAFDVYAADADPQLAAAIARIQQWP